VDDGQVFDPHSEVLLFPLWDREVEESEVAVWENQHYGDSTDYGIIKGLGDNSFAGEDGLIQVGSGESVNVHRESTINYQYCQDKGIPAHTLWWINPANHRDQRWFCVSCSKADHPDLYPAKWDWRDRKLIKQMRKANMLFVPGRRQECIDTVVRNYISNHANKLRVEHPSSSSSFHYQPQKMEHSYRKTAVLTAISAMKKAIADGDEPIQIQTKQKGGRRPGLGAKSIKKFCNRHFIGKYNLGTIKDMKKEIEIDSGQRSNNFNKYILVKRSFVSADEVGSGSSTSLFFIGTDLLINLEINKYTRIEVL
jgi:hypothetical protein